MSHFSDYELKDPVTEADIFACGGYTEEFFTKMHAKQGNVAEFLMYGVRNLSIANMDIIMAAHENCPIRPGNLFPILNYLGKENLLFRQNFGEVCKIRGKYESVIHSPGMYQIMHETTLEVIGEAVEKWSSGPAINLHAELSWLIYDIMGRLMFGSQWSSQSVGREIKSLHTYLIENSERWAYQPPEQSEKDPDYQKYVATIKQLREVCGKILEEKKAEGNNFSKVNAFSLLLFSKDDDGKDFFDTEFAISTMIGFLNGAYDTTHATLHWALFHLAKFPAVQEKLRQDILQVIGEKGSFTTAHCNQVRYLENFTKESQRCKPTTPINMRQNPDQDVTIGGTLIPKGTTVITPYFLAFRDPAVFGPGADDPLCFDPTRWEGDDEAARKRGDTLTPFGGGPRICVGFPLAKIEIKAAITTILRSTRVTLAEDVPIPMPTHLEAGVLQPVKKFMIKFEKLVQPSKGPQGMVISDAAKSGDGTTTNIGIRMTGTFQCPDCRQKFDTEKAKQLHWKFIHDPNRHQED